MIFKFESRFPKSAEVSLILSISIFLSIFTSVKQSFILENYTYTNTIITHNSNK
ncbi:MAG: hypothetical protein E7564_00110 [Ruminococcaceae bacterium]|nr:hypothetical protein [Oscillospiraceae bacterium]